MTHFVCVIGATPACLTPPCASQCALSIKPRQAFEPKLYLVSREHHHASQALRRVAYLPAQFPAVHKTWMSRHGRQGSSCYRSC